MGKRIFLNEVFRFGADDECLSLCVLGGSGLSWVMGDAEELPFNDDQFDIYTVAFGIRNVTHIEQVSDSTTTELDGNTDVPITTTSRL